MPFKSAAQRRKFAALLVEGKISPETFEEWNRETGSRKLPDHVKRKTGTKRKSAKPRAAAKNVAAKKKTIKKKRKRTGRSPR